jgi:hypothetical protein
MDELTQRLASGSQPVTLGGAQPTLEELRWRLEEIEVLLIKFTETRGGTELGVALDRPACDLSAADFDQGSGTVHVEGTLVLNDDPVRCIADIDLATLNGSGRLVLVEQSEVVA